MNLGKMEIREGVDLPPPIRKGRPKGSGSNLRLLEMLKGNKALWDVPYRKMLSIRQSGIAAGIGVTVRKIEDTGLYVIVRND